MMQVRRAPESGAPPYERVDPQVTRLLVIDVQNDFCDPDGWSALQGNDLTLIQKAVDNIAALLDAARGFEVRPIFVRAIYDPEFLSPPMIEQKRRAGLTIEHCRSGTWGADFYRVSPEAGEVVVTKHRYSAFIDTDLNALLRAQGVRNLIVTGVNTNVCVESTARDAFMLDYHVLLVSDCAATYDERAHAATLENIDRLFGYVVTMDDLVALWRAGLAA
jgi:ureidoacrylate peracid hydrolase